MRRAQYEVIPNGVLIPPEADPSGREHRILFVGRQEARKGLPVLLRAWPDIHRRTGARLRVIGADPLAVRLLLARQIPDEGIDVLGFLSQEDLTAELLSAKAMAAPSLGGESFGMVLTRAFACATPVVASDIEGYRDVMTAGDRAQRSRRAIPQRSADALVQLLVDEDRRCRLGLAGRRLAEERYSWEARSHGGWSRSTSRCSDACERLA